MIVNDHQDPQLSRIDPPGMSHLSEYPYVSQPPILTLTDPERLSVQNMDLNFLSLSTLDLVDPRNL